MIQYDKKYDITGNI